MSEEQVLFQLVSYLNILLYSLRLLFKQQKPALDKLSKKRLYQKNIGVS